MNRNKSIGFELKMCKKAQIMVLLVIVCMGFEVKLVSPIPSNNGSQIIYQNSSLQPEFNDTVYNKVSTCANELFTIIQFYKTDEESIIQISYKGIIIKKQTIHITTLFDVPHPILDGLDEINQTIKIKAGCLGNQTDIHNYFNKLTIQMTVQEVNQLSQKVGQEVEKTIEFSFLLGCDRGGRNKKFQYGYIIIAVINAAITIGVALHSKIWSIRIAGRPLSFELKWPRFIVLILITLVFGIVLYFIAAEQFKQANNALRYIGLVVGYIFTFICFNEAFYLVRFLKVHINKHLKKCDVISFIFSTIMFILGFFTDSWAYYDIIAIAICVGAIKMLRFSSMKQAFLSMLISVIAITTMAGVLHFVLQRSYNDYATELNSPLFIMIPDMVDQLFKKCSWLPVIDVIVPGVFLSFLRTYDQNYNTGWGGVYTVIGNLSFISSTILWVVLQALYPYSIPFSLITYSLLSLSIFIISMKRNQLQTLWQGRFNGANNQISAYLLNGEEQTDRNSFGDMVGQDIIDSIKYNIDKENEEHITTSYLKQRNSENKEEEKNEDKKWRSSIK